ncbi:MAG: UDP-N-acetylmuramoyl-tripeptide--D-alanyl-D-alanine ligase, partial [Gemmatimonadetes bacterium]|nr:UDP-N-acetylmuramoyl-tripeptide--D-alanyl-D-alanine ligase [Gemmatimonadota bacterium]
LARTILDSRETPDVAVLEVGASALGEIARLASLVRPAAAAVTNVAPAHLEGFGSIEGVRTEKLSLFTDLPSDALRLVDGDDPELVAAAEKYGRVTRAGFGEDNDLVPRDLQLDAAGRATFFWREHRLVLSVPGRHQAKNALFALAFAESLGVSPAEAVGRLATFTGVPGRLALLERNGVTIADDSYNSNPRSVDVALSWLVGAATSGRRVAVLGDMLELGTESEDFHAELGAKVAGLGLDLVVFVGPESGAAFAARPAAGGGEWHHVETAEHASELLGGLVAPGDLVLIKGSRGVGLDRVVRALAPAGEGA